MAKKKDETQADELDVLLKSKEFEGKHFGTSDAKSLKQDLITTGSFWFDYVLGGGFRSGSWSRFYGPPECGKTSQGLCWGKHWQDFYGDDAQVIYFNAEGRINADLINRSGIDQDPRRFRIVNMNNADYIYALMERLISTNPSGKRYLMILDSTDACIRDHDVQKQFNEAEKIGGGATIASAAGKRLSLVFNASGHHLYICSQERDKMNAQRPGAGGKDASGGNAPKFYSSLIGHVKAPWAEKYIFANPSDTKSEIIGRLVEIKLEKTPNEKTGRTVEIPVLYGRKGGVWREYEAMQAALAWGFVLKSGAWFNFTDAYAEDLTSNNITFEPKVHGEKALRELFNSNPALCEYVLTKVRNII